MRSSALLFVVLSPAFATAYPSCYESDVSWENNSFLDVISPVEDAQQCQILCKDYKNCTAWTWTTVNNPVFQEACLLFENIGAETLFPDSVSGLRTCVCSDNFACRGTPDNEISFHNNVVLEETCQELCFNTSGCEFYTWYDSSWVLNNLCVLLKSCDEKYSDCEGCYTGPPSCDTPQPDDLAILVTGGDGAYRDAEILFTNGTSLCSLPDMPQLKEWHTQSGLTTCGGYLSNINDALSCLKFVAGSWTTLTDSLLYPRFDHSSWVTPNGDIILIGGYESPNTTEIVYQNGTSIRSFDLMYETVYACSIELPEMFILTGGQYKNTVSRYNLSGWLGDLPDLNEGRSSHGCGFFYNEDMNRVFLVAGGIWSYNNYVSSTEVLIEGGLAWNFQQSLPTERWSLRGISLPDTVIMTGGAEVGSHLDDILKFEPRSSTWTKVGSLNNARYYHGASLVKLADVFPFCL